MAALDPDIRHAEAGPEILPVSGRHECGPDNPLGARAIYLFDGKHDTHLRIHGTNQPQSIGSAASNGCFRMINDHVNDLTLG
jgi:lipoprotein-anchoring transpeptidase ErfK/SrfK